jgi:hypothetical protein
MGAEHTPWWEYTACHGVDPTLFEARDGEHAGRPPERSLRANEDYCQRCPVRIECGADADRNKAEGLRGGLWRYWDKARANYRVKPVKPPARRPAVAPVKPGPVRYPCPVCARAVGAAWGALAPHKHQGRDCAGSGHLLTTAARASSAATSCEVPNLEPRKQAS